LVSERGLVSLGGVVVVMVVVLIGVGVVVVAVDVDVDVGWYCLGKWSV